LGKATGYKQQRAEPRYPASGSRAERAELPAPLERIGDPQISPKRQNGNDMNFHEAKLSYLAASTRHAQASTKLQEALKAARQPLDRDTANRLEHLISAEQEAAEGARDSVDKLLHWIQTV